jgi:hypothetical protein
MKKFLSLNAAILFFTFTAFSQSPKRQSANHSQILKLGVNTHFFPDEFPFSISWEKKIGTNESVQIGFLPRISNSDGDKTSGVGLNLGYRKYISKNRSGINGLFISPVIKVGFLKDKYEYSYTSYTGNPPQPITVTNKRSADITQFSGGFVFGHNWVFKSGFSFEVSGGMAYAYSYDKSINSNNGITNTFIYKESAIMPQALLSFGYAF